MSLITANRKRRQYPRADKLWVPRDIIRSQAFREMSKVNGTAVHLLLAFFDKVQVCLRQTSGKRSRKEYDVINGNNLRLSYAEARQEYNIFRGAFATAIKHIVNFGFLDVVRPGGLENRRTIFGLSNRYREWDSAEHGKHPRHAQRRSRKKHHLTKKQREALAAGRKKRQQSVERSEGGGHVKCPTSRT